MEGNTVKFALLETVQLRQDIPESNVKKGDVGAIVEVHASPCEVYEVEFCNHKGETVALLTVRPEQLMAFPGASHSS